MRRRLLAIAFGTAGLFVFGSVWGCGAIRAGLLLEDALKPPDALAGEVTDAEAWIATDCGDVRVRLTGARDRTGPAAGIVLVHGAVEGGASDPRLVALARALAVRGALVASPELDALTGFRLDGGDPARIAAVAGWLAARGDVRDHAVALIGISVGGSYALVAAADERLEGRLSTILAFGAYEDLDRVLRAWLCEPRRDAPGLFDPLTAGRQLVLLGNLDLLVPAPDRAAVSGAIRELYARRDPAMPAVASEEAGFVLEIARSEEPLTPTDAERILAPLATAVVALSPSAAGRPRTRTVFLLHGQGDPVIPPSELERLRATLAARGVTVEVHSTDLFQHVGTATGAAPSFFEAWPLLSFLADALDDAGL